jgi:flagellar basal body rod protein FlgF
MGKAGYTTMTGATATALAANVAKTCLCVISPAQFGIDLKKIRVSTDGVTASATPVLCEVMLSTLATNSTPGTNNSTGTVQQVYGQTITPGFTSFFSSTSEPTVLTLIDSFWVDPNKSTVIYDFPLGDTPDTAVSRGIVLRCTAAAIVNIRAAFWFERC